ncbi:hypothetical protein EON64_18725, partial [archaeon]
MSRLLVFSLRFCVTDRIFTEQTFELNEDFVKDTEQLKGIFQLLGCALFLLMPFNIFFVSFYTFCENATQFHSNHAYLNVRAWSFSAIFQFREFNELNHIFQARMNRALPVSSRYLRSFTSLYLTILCRCGVYVSGVLVACLLLVSTCSEGALLYVHIH